MDVRLWQAVADSFRQSDIDGAARLLETTLISLEADHFAGLVGLSFTNRPRSILDELNKFIQRCEQKFPAKAIYLEMNAFDINYDRWYFDLFGYSSCTEDPEDLEWLCSWQSTPWPKVALTGLKAVQADFAWYEKNEMWQDTKHAHIHEIATLLVMVRFLALIQAAVKSGPLIKPIPILAAVHDFDIVWRSTWQPR